MVHRKHPRYPTGYSPDKATTRSSYVRMRRHSVSGYLSYLEMPLKSSDESPASSDADPEAILGDLVIALKRLTIAGTPFAVGSTSRIFSAKLDEGSQTSMDVAVKEFARNGTESPNSNPFNIAKILTKEQPFNQHERHGALLCSIIKRCVPGRPEMLLELVPDAPEPKDATALRLFYSYFPLCWEYEPQKRPPISLLHRQVSIFSFVGDTGGSVAATLEEMAHLLIPPDRLRIVQSSELGAGNYGDVVLGILDEASPTARHVAVKRLRAVGTRGERVRLAKRLARELLVWAKIRHQNVVELIGFALDEKYETPMLISALEPNGDVLKYMGTFKPDIQRRIAFVQGITAGLECLHNFDPPICHGDLKPANVLIDFRLNAVLCDFGLASFVGDSAALPGLATTTTIKGTPRYMSPELYLEADCKHCLESDVLTSKFPYDESPGDVQLCMAMVNKRPPGDVNLLLPNKFEDASPESALTLQFLHSTLPHCWNFEPQLRPCTRVLLFQLSNPSYGGVPPASNEDIESSASMEGTSFPLASPNPAGVLVDSGECAQGAAGGVAVHSGPGSENLRKRKRAGSSSSGDTGGNDNARRVRTRLEGNPDGTMKGEEEEEREEDNDFKAHLLALLAAIDESAQAREGQITTTSVRGIRQALGDKWESQLTTVLQNINRDKKGAGTSDRPKASEEGQA
ncbi:hypothetical protein FRC00_004817 [Tulasnella sp. 408]|nr:hypothetical protein FRC00_004817 [Tulasnella sp. 408]